MKVYDQKYDEIRKKFQEHDVIVGIGDYVGMSEVIETKNENGTIDIQPFSYLGCYDQTQFRHASQEEWEFWMGV